MTESTFSRKLLKALRSHAALKDAVIFKHADRFSAGIPDFSVTTSEGRTTWWEMKVYPNHPTKLQAYFLNRLCFSWCVYLHQKNTAYYNRPLGILIPPSAETFTFESAVEEIVRRCVDA